MGSMNDYDNNQILFRNFYCCEGTVKYECDSRKFYLKGVTTGMIAGKNYSDVRFIKIVESKFDLIPTNFNKFFPNIGAFQCVHCDISNVESMDLEQFSALKWIDVSKNLISYLPGDLFKNHKSLEYFSVAENPIETIGDDFFDQIPNLKKFSFSKTACLLGFTAGSLEEEKHEVLEECSSNGTKKKQLKTKGRNKPTSKTKSKVKSKPKSKLKMRKFDRSQETCEMTYLFEEKL
jgi:hypothetical protein